MKLFSCQPKIVFSIILLLTPLFATSFFCKSVLAGETKQSDKFFAFVSYDIVNKNSPNVVVKSVPNSKGGFDSNQSALDWIVGELKNAGINADQTMKNLRLYTKKTSFDYFSEKLVIASKNMSYKFFTKSVNVARINDDKSTKEIETIDTNISTFIENFENFVSVFKSFSSPDQQLTISDVNTLIASANNLRKSTSIVGDDMKYVSSKNSSPEQLIAVKNMLTSLDNVTSFLEVLIPSLNNLSSSISLSE